MQANRRQVIKTAGLPVIGGLFNTQNRDSVLASIRQTSQPSVTGRIVDLQDEPVSDAQVWVFDNATFDELTRVSTDSKGRFSLSRTYDDVLVAARSNEWFGTFNFSTFNGDGALTLDRQFLFGPEVGYTSDDSPLGAVSLWRWVATNSTDQIVFIEVTNTNHLEEQPIHELNGIGYDLSSGYFSLTFPEDEVDVDYGSQDWVKNSLDPQGATAYAINSNDSSDQGPLTKSHPLHPETPGLPTFETLTVEKFEERAGTSAGNSEIVDEGLGRLAGVLPVVGTVMTWVNTIDWAFGNSLQSEAIIGEESVDPPDPNVTDTVFLGWRSKNRTLFFDEAAAVCLIPIRFKTNDETDFTVNAEWKYNPIGSLTTGHALFTKKFSIGPDVLTGEGTDSETGEDGSSGTEEANRTLKVVKEGAEQGLAAFMVTVSGNIEAGQNSEAVIDGSSAIDWLGPRRGTDNLHFSGEITEFILKGDATVYIDGNSADPDDLGTQ